MFTPRPWIFAAMSWACFACGGVAGSDEPADGQEIRGSVDAGGSQADAVIEASSPPPVSGGAFLSSQLELPSLTPEECEEAFSDSEDPQGLCESDTSPRLLLLRGQLCALYASGLKPENEEWDEVRFDLDCYEVERSDGELSAKVSVAGLGRGGEELDFGVDGSTAVASTQTGVWFDQLFLSAENLESTVVSSLEPSGLRQLAFADLVSSSGALEPDGLPDALTIYAHWDSDFICEGNSVPVRRIVAGLYPAKNNGTFGPLRVINAGWGTLSLHPFAIYSLGAGSSGAPVLALPAERRSPGPEYDACFEEKLGGVGLIGTLKSNQDGSFDLQTIIAEPDDLHLLNMRNPMGFARLPDNSGFLGTFSGMSGNSHGSGFSFVGMDGAVSHFSLPYKGQTFSLDYPAMELDFGGVPFDVAVAEKADGTLLLVHTSRVTDTYLVEVNGLYITSLHPDGTQETQYVFSHGKPTGLISFSTSGGGLFFASASSYSRGAADRGLPYNPQLQIWSVPGFESPPPFTSQGYSWTP